MSSQSIEELFQLMVIILTKHGLDSYLEGYDAELVNLLMSNHLQEVQAADSYEACMKMMNEAIAVLLGAPITVDQFMPSDVDRQACYSLFQQWRGQLLAPA